MNKSRHLILSVYREISWDYVESVVSLLAVFPLYLEKDKNRVILPNMTLDTKFINLKMSVGLKNWNIKGVGRGALLNALASADNKTLFASSESQFRRQEVADMPLSAISSLTSSLEAVNIKTPDSVSPSASEKFDERLNLVSNCFGFLKLDNVEIYEYEVCFWPPLDSRATKRQFLDIALEEINVTMSTISIDYTKLRVAKKIAVKEVTSVVSKLPNSQDEPGSVTTVVFKYSGLCPNSDLIQHYNDVLNSALNKLNMHHLIRNYFSTKNIVNLPNHGFEVWQGYDTEIKECEDGFLLQCDVISKVVHINSVLDVLTKCYYNNRETFRADFERKIKGHSVMTRYKTNSYRVDDISWDMNPSSTFALTNGETIPFVEYYKRTYDLQIKDVKQPLLIHRKVFNGDTSGPDLESKPQEIFLIPELCYLIGITDDMRANNKLMRDINFHIRASPNLHRTRVQELVESICNNEETKALLSDWGMSFGTSPIQMKARLMKREALTIGGKSMFEVNERAAWAKDIEDEQVLNSVPLKEWAVICPETAVKTVREFCKVISNTLFNLGVEYSELQPIEVPNDIDSYLRTTNELIFNTDVQLLVFILADNFEHAKTLETFCLEFGVASHVTRVSKISDARILRRVTQEISRHIICKLGGELWSVHIPSKFHSTMVCGIDMYNRREDSTIVGFVASFNRSFTKWHCSVAYQKDDEELIDCLTDNIGSAFKKYIQVNKALPDKIVVYRTGVSDTVLNNILNDEVTKLKEVLFSFKDGYAPEIVVIVVLKTRIRLYLDSGISNNGMVNPFPGTVIDRSDPSGSFHDFLLVSRYVNQGTVPPTRYVIMYNTSTLKMEDLQSLCFKLTHLCFKQPCSAGFPAPIMYAHDIAQYYLDMPQHNGMVVYHNTLFFF